MQACETFETNPKIVRGVDCGGKLGFFVSVAGLGYLICGYVVGAVFAMSWSRGAKEGMGEGRRWRVW